VTPHRRKALAPGPSILGVFVLVLSLLPAHAIIDATLQMQLGNPSGATAEPTNHYHYLIQRTVQAIDYSDHYGQPLWASWDLTAADIGSSGRTDAWAPDTSLPAGFYQVPINGYSGSGYDRGHMCPSADRTDTVANNELVFIMSNIIPQASQQNQNIWANFENYCRNTLLPGGNELLIICGPSGFTTSKLSSDNHVYIPGYTWKIVVVVPGGAGTATNRITPTTQVVALRLPNTDAVGYDSWQNYRTNVVAIEADTGFTFFTALAPNLATVLRNKIDGQAAPAPALAGFSPAGGPGGTSVTITGTNLVFATNVTFNGSSAAFTISSTTNLIVTVPAGATTGPITVATLGGTATSTGSFTVGGSNVVDLAIGVTHTGSFAQGDTGDTYTIMVTNVGTAGSSSTVTVSDTLPAGLTATAIGGSGWTADLGTLSCTRSDLLPAGVAYPAITVTVNVASNALLSVTNIVAVSGGGDSSPGNNTAIDPTIIQAASTGSTVITLAGWDTSGLPGGANNYGPSPFAPTTNAANLTVVGLTRGSGVGTGNSGAWRGWGGNTWTDTSSAAAIAANRYATFSIGANSGYKVSFAAISKFDYRHSATGPSTGLLQYQVGSGAFADITTLSYPSNTASGGSLSPIDLSGIPALQNVGAGTNITFRIVNWGGTSAAGTWYVFDLNTNTAPDLVVQGSVAPLITPTVDLAIALTHTGTFTQGDAADTYTILVTNVGPAATTGSVTVADVLPPGLSTTGLAGSGWSMDLANLTCTRSDPLPTGASYPPITLTVSVGKSVPASITNIATVSGGGDTSPSNNTAADPTSILPAAAPAVSTDLATAIGTGVATLNGTLNPNGQPAAAQFEYGLSTSYGSVLPVPGGYLGKGAQTVSASVSGLLPGATYHFRLAATNVLGEATGEDQVFITLTPIEAWRLQWFGTMSPLGPAADTAVATSDGMPNLLKYALGLEPLVATNDPVEADISTGYLRLTVPKNPQATDVSFHVEVTSDLTGSWTKLGTTVDTNTPTLLQVHADVPVAESQAGYIRLRVSRP
jgi:uncharacterized repeat protein (TIGR01451 family)